MAWPTAKELDGHSGRLASKYFTRFAKYQISFRKFRIKFQPKIPKNFTCIQWLKLVGVFLVFGIGYKIYFSFWSYFEDFEKLDVSLSIRIFFVWNLTQKKSPIQWLYFRNIVARNCFQCGGAAPMSIIFILYIFICKFLRWFEIVLNLRRWTFDCYVNSF